MQLHGTASDDVLQGIPFQILHRDEGCVVFFANLVNGADVRMIQGRRGLGFALKAAECLWVFGYLFGQKLEGHEAAELHILGLVDDTHSATTEFFDDAVVRDCGADERIRAGHLLHILGLEPEASQRTGL